MRGVDLVLEDGHGLDGDAQWNPAALGLVQDLLAHGAEEVHGLANLVLGIQNFSFDVLRDGDAEPLDEPHGLLAAARREREDDALGLDVPLPAQGAVLLQELDHGFRVVDGLRDEPTHPELALLDQSLVLVALLDVTLGDGHAAVGALLALVELGGDVGDGGTAVLVGGRGAADEVVGVDTVIVDGLVEPPVKAARVGLRDALVHDGFLTGDVLEHLGEVGGIVELAEGERTGLRSPSLLLLDVVDDEAVGGERGAALDELARGLLQLILGGALERGRQACVGGIGGGRVDAVSTRVSSRRRSAIGIGWINGRHRTIGVEGSEGRSPAGG